MREIRELRLGRRRDPGPLWQSCVARRSEEQSRGRSTCQCPRDRLFRSSGFLLFLHQNNQCEPWLDLSAQIPEVMGAFRRPTRLTSMCLWPIIAFGFSRSHFCFLSSWSVSSVCEFFSFGSLVACCSGPGTGRARGGPGASGLSRCRWDLAKLS